MGVPEQIVEADRRRVDDPRYTDDRGVDALEFLFQATQEQVQGEFRGAKVVNVGSGSGRMSGELRELGATVDDVDFSERARDSTDPDHVFILSNATDLDIPDASYDRSVSSFVIGHIPTISGRVKAIGEQLRVTRPGGRGYCDAVVLSDGTEAEHVGQAQRC